MADLKRRAKRQIEHYFLDSDAHLDTTLKTDGFVPLSTILTWGKMISLAEEYKESVNELSWIDFVRTALLSSQVVTVNPKNEVRRCAATSVSLSSNGVRTEEYDGTQAVSHLGAGDSSFLPHLLSLEEADDALVAFGEDGEISWGRFKIRGSFAPRLVCVQGVPSESGCMPLYRHPVDYHPLTLPLSPTAKRIKDLAEAHCSHPLNHALIQLYRDGQDFIGEHSDKTLDIKHDTSIITVSLGSSRTLILKAKDGSKVQKIVLPHGSLYRLGWKTNIEYTHAIHKCASHGPRVSLTLRCIATFHRADGRLFGQGAQNLTEADLARSIQSERVFFGVSLLTPPALAQLTGCSWRTIAVVLGATYGLLCLQRRQRRRKQALRLYQLFGEMNKGTTEDAFRPLQGSDSVTYEHT